MEDEAIIELYIARDERALRETEAIYTTTPAFSKFFCMGLLKIGQRIYNLLDRRVNGGGS